MHIPGTQTEIPENLTESLSKLEINPGFALGLDIFAGVELCKESLDAFNRQIDVADLFLFLSTPISLLSAQNVEYRKTACVCLTKLCRAKGNAKILQEYLKSAGMDLDFIAVPLRMSLDSSDLHFKEQALKALSYLTDDTGADFIRRHSFAADMVRCVCVPDGAEGVAEEALACLTRTRRGLGEVFSGAALEQLEAALTAPEDNTALAAAGLVVRLSAESPEALECALTLGVARALAPRVRSNDDLTALAALELAASLTPDAFDPTLPADVLADAIVGWQLRDEAGAAHGAGPDPSEHDAEVTGDGRSTVSGLDSDLLHERRLCFACRAWRDEGSSPPPAAALLQQLAAHLARLASRR